MNRYLALLGALRACEAGARLMRTKAGEGGIKQIARFRCALDSRVVLLQMPHKNECSGDGAFSAGSDRPAARKRNDLAVEKATFLAGMNRGSRSPPQAAR